MIKQHPMTAEQLERVLNAAKPDLRTYAMFLIASNHAIRSSELSHLRTADISLRDRTIYIRRLKGSRSETEAIFDETELNVLSRWLAEKPAHELLFPSCRGGALSRTQVYNIFRHYSELVFNPAVCRGSHAFRHTIGQALADGGLDIKRLQRVMGHKNLNSTSQYFDVSQRECDELKKKIFANRGVAA
jgi:integrase